MNNIKILGCGWLGLPLASHFVSKGNKVSGSTSTVEKMNTLNEHSINAYLLDLPEKIYVDFFEGEGIIIINIPPQSRTQGEDFHKRCIQAILPFIKAHHQVIYVSATSVYPDNDEEITEETPVDRDSKRAKALWQVEDLLRDKLNDRLCILRCGGLLGYDRIPGKYSSGKEVDTGEEKVNYIHRDDVLHIIELLIEQQAWGKTFNVVAPKHPSKKEVYLKNADKHNFEKPVFIDKAEQLTKRYISGNKLEEFLDYSFIYPDPLDFYYT